MLERAKACIIRAKKIIAEVALSCVEQNPFHSGPVPNISHLPVTLELELEKNDTAEVHERRLR